MTRRISSFSDLNQAPPEVHSRAQESRPSDERRSVKWQPCWGGEPMPPLPPFLSWVSTCLSRHVDLAVAHSDVETHRTNHKLSCAIPALSVVPAFFCPVQGLGASFYAHVWFHVCSFKWKWRDPGKVPLRELQARGGRSRRAESSWTECHGGLSINYLFPPPLDGNHPFGCSIREKKTLCSKSSNEVWSNLVPPLPSV